jgi:hypothetical protein
MRLHFIYRGRNHLLAVGDIPLRICSGQYLVERIVIGSRSGAAPWPRS